ncbi:hypothetical protein ELG95_32805 (plasmid) [Rhizobium ruizarguesonis]|nr:hypothetical protein ELG95_32805 [Rhizobium ruizarguesonis]
MDEYIPQLKISRLGPYTSGLREASLRGSSSLRKKTTSFTRSTWTISSTTKRSAAFRWFVQDKILALSASFVDERTVIVAGDIEVLKSATADLSG